MPTPILGQPHLTASQLTAFVRNVNPSAPQLSDLYLQIGNLYGVRGDIAFVQSVLETNYFRFTGDVQPSQNNFAGIGAVGSDARGASFPDAETGIEAQIQHLYAYATSAPLPVNVSVVDPRFHLVNRGSAPNWGDLSGKWATDLYYGEKIVGMYEQIEQTTLPDVPSDHWAYPSIVRAVDLGLMIGYDTGRFAPDQPVTRDQLAVVINRFLNLANNLPNNK